MTPRSAHGQGSTKTMQRKQEKGKQVELLGPLFEQISLTPKEHVMNRAIPIIASLPLAFTMAADAGQVLHNGPWTCLFGNHLDTHQESKLNKDGTQKGRLYIIFTEDEDPESGLPIARHRRGAGQDEECGVDSKDCVVGWNFTARPGSAKFLYHQGVNGDDHPVWMVNRVDIPNPGVFNHFH